MIETKPSTKEWGVARGIYNQLESHGEDCKQCKARSSYRVGRCATGETLHADFEDAVGIARDATPDKRKLTKAQGRRM